MYFIIKINKKLSIQLITFAFVKSNTMKQRYKIQTTLLLTVFALAVWMKFYNPSQNLLLEFTSDITIVVMLLGFSELLIRSLILFPVNFVTKAFQFLKTQTANQ
jgi:hypothetical protein